VKSTAFCGYTDNTAIATIIAISAPGMCDQYLCASHGHSAFKQYTKDFWAAGEIMGSGIASGKDWFGNCKYR
jgi:hypothetical protein